jgi:uncharacterized membrane protein
MSAHATGQSDTAGNASASWLIPPGLSSNPSRWSKRAPLAVLAAIGCLVALYLTLYQTGVIDTVWEPFFGHGSVKILDSSLARSLPVPDAALGAFAYFCEVVLDLIGGEDRWRRLPHVTIVFGLLALGMALGSIGLVLLQAFYFSAFCTLCLVSAAISLIIVGPALGEPIASITWLRIHHHTERT